MHHSTKTARLNKQKIKNNHMSFPYNAGIHFLPASSTLHSRQIQINGKHFNNIGNINEASVLQCQRTSNFQIKNNNHFQNLSHQQQQFSPKTSHYQNNLNTNLLQKTQVTYPLQRKVQKEQRNPPAQSLSNVIQTHKIDEISCKDILPSGSRELIKFQIQQKPDEKCNNVKPANNKLTESKSSLLNSKLYAQSEKVPNKCKNEENKFLNNSAASSADVSSSLNNKKRHENLNIINVVEERNVELNIVEEINVEQNVNQVYNCNNSEVVHYEDINEKPLKNAREKTPMCLINDLARFNKISFQYRLTSENGPAHCKRFTVTLKLGDEEYTAEGLKIKKAQHLAAKEAIERTKYKHPTPKTNRRNDENSVTKSNITPTVELNALAMKLCQQTYYIFDPRQVVLPENNFTQNNTWKTNLRSSHSFDTNKATQKSASIVEDFIGTFNPNMINNDKQVQVINQKQQFLPKYQNRLSPFQYSVHNGAALKSNSLVSTYFPVTSPCKITLIVGTKKFEGVGRTLQQAKHNAASNALQVLKEQINNQHIEPNNESLDDIDNKSPISLVFEIGVKRNLPVEFKVLREEGPAHMRTFITACIVGDIVTEGEGTGKKVSKKMAAQKMLEELNKLPPLTPVASPIKRVKLKIPSKKSGGGQPKAVNLVDSKEEMEGNWNGKQIAELDSPNPIVKLLEWHQNRKEKEPVFKLISEFGKDNSRRRQFVMEVSSNNTVARGIGNSKKLAKRDAAQNFLIAVSGSGKIPSISESDNNLKRSNSVETINNLELNTEIPSKQEDVVKSASNSTFSNKNSDESIKAVVSKNSHNSSSLASSKSQNLRMKDQLLYLAKLLGFEVDFSDYPKGNHNDFLTIVMLSTNPPQICHGVGINAKESQEDAAKNALKILSEMGLNNAVKT